METLLLVENEMKLVELMKPFLEKEGYFILHVSKGSDVVPILHSKKVDKIILDVMLDDLDGWRVLRDIKSLFQIPVLMLSARSEESDRLFGFELGCDDYMTKPFSMKELVFRLQKLTTSQSSSDFSFDTLSYQVHVFDQTIAVTKTEHELLKYFLEHEKEVISRERLLEHVWGYMYEGETRVVDTTITRLRKKLAPLNCIHTVFGVGYKWEIMK